MQHLVHISHYIINSDNGGHGDPSPRSEPTPLENQSLGASLTPNEVPWGWLTPRQQSWPCPAVDWHLLPMPQESRRSQEPPLTQPPTQHTP